MDWTDDDLERLTALVKAKVSPARASAQLGRTVAAVRRKAYALGTPFPTLAQRRRDFNLKAQTALSGQETKPKHELTFPLNVSKDERLDG